MGGVALCCVLRRSIDCMVLCVVFFEKGEDVKITDNFTCICLIDAQHLLLRQSYR